jgi:hypothetical protein
MSEGVEAMRPARKSTQALIFYRPRRLNQVWLTSGHAATEPSTTNSAMPITAGQPSVTGHRAAAVGFGRVAARQKAR